MRRMRARHLRPRPLWVLAGTDWPILAEKDVPSRLQKALTAAGLNTEQQQMVAGGNTLRLLGIT
jgi:hypothetical protein